MCHEESRFLSLFYRFNGTAKQLRMTTLARNREKNIIID